MFAPDENAFNNLRNEGISIEKVFMVGNTSVDACLRVINLFNQEKLKYSLIKDNYVLLTLHRQENTSYDGLKEILGAINTISKKIKVLFPVHLRTKKIIAKYKMEIEDNIILTDPLGYN